MNKAQFIEAVQTDRARWDTLLAEAGETRMLQPGVEGDWTLKDVIAHITWYESEMVTVMRARALAGSDWWDLPLDQRNATIFNANRDRPLAEVLAESRSTYQELLTALRALPEEALNDASLFRDMPTDWIPQDMIASNTYEHYADHIPVVQSWLASLTQSPH